MSRKLALIDAHKRRQPCPLHDCSPVLGPSAAVAITVASDAVGSDSTSSGYTKRRRMDELPRGHVAPRLLKRVGQGTLATSEACAIANDIVKDYGDKHDLVSGIASLGKHGKHLQNAQRELFTWTRTRKLQIQTGLVNCTVVSKSTHGTCPMPIPCIYPHELFSAVKTQLPAKAFEEAFVGPNGVEGLQQFWSGDSDWRRHHPGRLGRSYVVVWSSLQCLRDGLRC